MNSANKKFFAKILKKKLISAEAEQVIPIHANGLVELRLINKPISLPNGEYHPKSWQLIANQQLSCKFCGKPIASNQVVYLLKPQLVINCLNCCHAGNVRPHLLPNEPNWKFAIPCMVKYEKGGR